MWALDITWASRLPK